MSAAHVRAAAYAHHFTALIGSWSWSCEIMYHAFPTFLHGEKTGQDLNNSYPFNKCTALPTSTNACQGVVRDETCK